MLAPRQTAQPLEVSSFIYHAKEELGTFLLLYHCWLQTQEASHALVSGNLWARFSHPDPVDKWCLKRRNDCENYLTNGKWLAQGCTWNTLTLSQKFSYEYCKLQKHIYMLWTRMLHCTWVVLRDVHWIGYTVKRKKKEKKERNNRINNYNNCWGKIFFFLPLYYPIFIVSRWFLEQKVTAILMAFEVLS